jgi:hypothetical protein
MHKLSSVVQLQNHTRQLNNHSLPLSSRNPLLNDPLSNNLQTQPTLQTLSLLWMGQPFKLCLERCSRILPRFKQRNSNTPRQPETQGILPAY